MVQMNLGSVDREFDQCLSIRNPCEIYPYLEVVNEDEELHLPFEREEEEGHTTSSSSSQSAGEKRKGAPFNQLEIWADEEKRTYNKLQSKMDALDLALKQEEVLLIGLQAETLQLRIATLTAMMDFRAESKILLRTESASTAPNEEVAAAGSVFDEHLNASCPLPTILHQHDDAEITSDHQHLFNASMPLRMPDDDSDRQGYFDHLPLEEAGSWDYDPD